MGIDKVLEILPQIMALDINLFLFGRSEEPNIAALLSQREIYPNLRIVSEDEEPIFNKLLAASDFFMAPYTHPFMGRDRRIAMRYGAVPIVRKYANELYYQMEEIVKFRYINMSDLPDVVARAIELYNDKEMMDRYRSDIMRFDNSWEESARKYEELYKKLTI
jgi:starch synthase